MCPTVELILLRHRKTFHATDGNCNRKKGRQDIRINKAVEITIHGRLFKNRVKYIYIITMRCA